MNDRRDIAIRQTIAAALLLGGLALVAVPAQPSCKGTSVPTAGEVEAGAAVAADVCSYIDGVDDTGIVRVICATVAEVAQIVEFVLLLRATSDGGSLDAATACKPLPGSALCATSAERAKGILFVSHMRTSRLFLDGSAP